MRLRWSVMLAIFDSKSNGTTNAKIKTTRRTEAIKAFPAWHTGQRATYYPHG